MGIRSAGEIAELVVDKKGGRKAALLFAFPGNYWGRVWLASASCFWDALVLTAWHHLMEY